MYRTQRYSDAIIVLLFEDNDSHLNSFKPINVGLCHIGQYGLYPSNRTCKTNMLSQEHYINVASYHVRCMYTEGLMKLNEYWDLGIVYSGE